MSGICDDSVVAVGALAGDAADDDGDIVVDVAVAAGVAVVAFVVLTVFPYSFCLTCQSC